MRSAPVKRGCTTIRSPVSRSITTSFALRQLRRIVASCSRFAIECALTSRSTSALRTETFFIFRPRIAPSRSRAIVSVSGSSGTAHNLPPPDVTPQLLSLARHLLGVRSRQLRGLDETGGDRGHREHPASGGYELISPWVERGSRMKYLDTLLGRWELDNVASPGLLRIARRGDYGRNRGERFPIWNTRAAE